jgi:hypothetical protein
MRRFLLVLAALIAVGAGVLILLGRGRVRERDVQPRPFAAAGEATLQTLRLYFADPDGGGLVREDRSAVMPVSLTERLATCIRELAEGSHAGNLPVLPSRSGLARAFVDPWGLAYLDFDAAVVASSGDREEWLVVASIVRTVCENFPEVREVRFMVGGQVVTSLGGYIDLEEPLGPEDFPLLPAQGFGDRGRP